MENERFTELYLSNYARLLRLAYIYVQNREDAENLVHDVFASIWEKRDYVFGMESVTGYLSISLRNRAYDFLKHKAYEQEHSVFVSADSLADLSTRLNLLATYDMSTYDNVLLHDAVRDAIAKLPPRCREIYLCSRRDHLRYCDIAEKLGISVNTVEAQMGIALRKLRESLQPYLSNSKK